LRTTFFDALASMAASGAADGWLESEIARLYHVVREAAHQDVRKPFEDEEFEQAVGELITFAHTRPAFVQAQAARLR
jgi:hypothetical protein